MRLTPTEVDRLLVFLAAELARRRRARGLRLNYPEAVAIIADTMHEAARDGAGYEEVVAAGAAALTEDEVMEGVPELLGTVRVECLFSDGMRVVAVERPIRPRAGMVREDTDATG
jgi:urease subunit gamma/beta